MTSCEMKLEEREMNSETRYFCVTGKVYLDRDDVLAWLGTYMAEDDELAEDYQPTDDEWLGCAQELFEDDEIRWSESSLIPD